MTSLDLTLENFEIELEGWPFTTRLERRLNKVQGDGYHEEHLQSLKESNLPAYKHARRLIRIGLWKTRRSKFIRYKDNMVKCFEGYRNNLIKSLEDCKYV